MSIFVSMTILKRRTGDQGGGQIWRGQQPNCNGHMSLWKHPSVVYLTHLSDGYPCSEVKYTTFSLMVAPFSALTMWKDTWIIGRMQSSPKQQETTVALNTFVVLTWTQLVHSVVYAPFFFINSFLCIEYVLYMLMQGCQYLLLGLMAVYWLQGWMMTMMTMMAEV